MAISKNILFLFIISTYVLNNDCFFQKETITRVDRFDVCRCPKNCVVQNFESELWQHERSSTRMEFRFTLQESFSKVRLAVISSRCKSKDSLDTCELLSPLKADQACYIMNLRDAMWTPFTDSFTPPFRCPFVKGNYTSKNSIFDANMYKILPLQGWYYRSRIDLFNETDTNLLWSFCMEFSVVNLV